MGAYNLPLNSQFALLKQRIDLKLGNTKGIGKGVYQKSWQLERTCFNKANRKLMFALKLSAATIPHNLKLYSYKFFPSYFLSFNLGIKNTLVKIQKCVSNVYQCLVYKNLCSLLLFLHPPPPSQNKDT